MAYWLMKSEPKEVSFDDVWARSNKTVDWFGVRNYQARNFMRDGMALGDGVLFYHSSCAVPGIAGLAEIASQAYPDPLQFNKKSPHYDAKSTPDKPRWLTIDVRATHPTRYLPLAEMYTIPALAAMRVLQKGNRLSITPVSADEWHTIISLIGA